MNTNNLRVAQQLKGKRILVTALDLEQREHRGIAVYSKALIRHLHHLGAEVWLLTQFSPRISDLRALPKQTQKIIYSSRTLNELVNGKTTYTSKLEDLIPYLGKLGNRYRRFKRSLRTISNKHFFRASERKVFRLRELSDNPNLRISRLNYLEYVEGVVSLNDIYEESQIAALRKKSQPVKLDLSGFDAFISYDFPFWYL